MHPFQNEILKAATAQKISKTETIQELWSGYGTIQRIHLEGNQKIPSLIAKHIKLPKAKNHPKGWNTNQGHHRKIKSYEVEQNWYEKNQASSARAEATRSPGCLLNLSFQNEKLILLEDLNPAGYPIRKTQVSLQEIKIVLKWLANFHAIHLNQAPTGLWEIGTYWHLATRPEEFQIMVDGPLKNHAFEIDKKLNDAEFKTIVHGDAKLANFCFSENGQKVAAVDFQYVGGGCGMKDVAYFLGSCLGEDNLFQRSNSLLDYYFQELRLVLKGKLSKLSQTKLEEEWLYLFDFAWADFDRFLLGWMPTHAKITKFSQDRVAATIHKLKS